MQQRIITYESQIEEKGKDALNLIIEIRPTDNGLLIYVERHTILEIRMGNLVIRGSDWNEQEAREVALEAIELADDQRFTRKVTPYGIGLVEGEKGGVRLVWNRDVLDNNTQEPQARALALAEMP